LCYYIIMKNSSNIENMKFTENLKAIRITKHLTQKDVAIGLSIPISTYANWEQGRTEPNIQELFKLIKFFEIDANDLFDLDSI
ncbi:MAG: helix-turn-helix domain-containing protein, partial [Clostridia bacterium]|nr:helix-turn-helix domain-containing protein [Clostridia bacterium]